MSVQEYWESDPYLFWAYRIAYIDKMEYEYEFANYKEWLNGLYNLKALEVINSTEKVEYFDMPIDFKGMRQEEDRKRKQEKLENQMRAYLANKSMSLNKKKGS